MFVDQFLAYLKYEKRFSPHTQNSYSKDLKQFAFFIETDYELTDPTKVSHLMVRSWIVHLMEKGLSPRSVHRKISSLKAFYKFLRREGSIVANPMAKVIAPKMSKRLPVFVEEENMLDLFERDLFSEDFSGLRDQLIIEMLYTTGIRLSEMIHITNRDLDLQRKTLKVLGKRNKERIVPISEVLWHTIKRYLDVKRETRFVENSEFLLVLDNGAKLYEKFVYRRVNHYLGMITTIHKKSPHVLRHTFATHMLNHGADLSSIKEFLGHADLAATQVYTHNTIDKLKRIHKQAHPRG